MNTPMIMELRLARNDDISAAAVEEEGEVAASGERSWCALCRGAGRGGGRARISYN